MSGDVVWCIALGPSQRYQWVSPDPMQDLVSLEHDGKRRDFSVIRAANDGESPGKVEFVRHGTSIMIKSPADFRIACLVNGKVEGDEDLWDEFENFTRISNEIP